MTLHCDPSFWVGPSWSFVPSCLSRTLTFVLEQGPGEERLDLARRGRKDLRPPSFGQRSAYSPRRELARRSLQMEYSGEQEFPSYFVIISLAKRRAPSFVNFVPALAYHFCRTLLTAFAHLGARLLAEPRTAILAIYILVSSVQFVSVRTLSTALETQSTINQQFGLSEREPRAGNLDLDDELCSLLSLVCRRGFFMPSEYACSATQVRCK